MQMFRSYSREDVINHRGNPEDCRIRLMSTIEKELDKSYDREYGQFMLEENSFAADPACIEPISILLR